MRLSVVLFALCVMAGIARAQPVPGSELSEDPEAVSRSRESVGAPGFGPLIVIETIAIRGNTATADDLIRDALPFAPGDKVRVGDPRFETARFKILALGYFRDAQLSLEKGSARGKVIVVVDVKERGTILLRKLYLGTSAHAPVWVGFDLTERNFLGTGVGVGGQLAHAAEGQISGSTPQWSAKVRLRKPALFGTRLGAGLSIYHVSASEPYRVLGDPESADPDNFRAFSYRRTGARAGVGFDLAALARVFVLARAEHIDSDVPAMPVRTFAGGAKAPIDLFLAPDESHIVSLGFGFDHDTRTHPVLPTSGRRLIAYGEIAADAIGSSYDYTKLLLRYERWWSLGSPAHVLSAHLKGGAVFGDPPRFERIYIGDINRLLTPRAAGLVVAARPPPALLSGGDLDLSYGELFSTAAVEYSQRLFRKEHWIYGGDVFVGAGGWMLAANRSQPSALSPESAFGAWIDIGIRLDTEIGIFELSLANALGRIAY
ncbi:MAG TPA: BamA/TamA family outer membrane protein [Kofleriaceae bacterium]|nr:BamA/TamA family outer membrane protein [Kofleriaceae bacterium]